MQGFFLKQETKRDQKQMCQKGLQHVMVPTLPGTGFKMIKSTSPFASSKAVSTGPSPARDAGQFCWRTIGGYYSNKTWFRVVRPSDRRKIAQHHEPGNWSRTGVTRIKAISTPRGPLLPSLMTRLCHYTQAVASSVHTVSRVEARWA